MNKATIVSLSACLMLAVSGASVSASAATEPMHKMEKSIHKAEHKAEHKMHMKSHKGKEHKLHQESVNKEHKIHAKSVTPKALPKTGYGGVSE
ncbi:hypothetical protein [Paenibacillus sp. AD87]|uniref:hypothetical protein n=1 Tax=Paenibacillus sp. AD87 TaxID=1528787 RepID=UPI0007E3D7CF|nr:hypothetical protein [Paenibacillus sp. AD87]OAX49798.1 hypothetical protein gpAD87_16525 [Paenibacillus sp. AD87]